MDKRMYALPLGILLAGFILYYFVFDSLQYEQHQSIVITQKIQDNNMQSFREDLDMQQEVEQMRENVEITFATTSLPQNINNMDATTNIVFKEKKPRFINNETEVRQEAPQVNKENSVSYTPYKQVNTHKLPNMFESNLNVPTNIKLYANNPFDLKPSQNAQKKTTKWVVPNTKTIKLYAAPNTHAKIVAANKNGIKMQLLEQKKAWGYVRYAERRGRYIEGYVPLSMVRSAR